MKHRSTRLLAASGYHEISSKANATLDGAEKPLAKLLALVPMNGQPLGAGEEDQQGRCDSGTGALVRCIEGGIADCRCVLFGD